MMGKGKGKIIDREKRREGRWSDPVCRSQASYEQASYKNEDIKNRRIKEDESKTMPYKTHHQRQQNNEARPNQTRPDRHTIKPIYLLLLNTFVIACRIIVPAFSTSRRERPVVKHTFSAGGVGRAIWFGTTLSGILFTRVMSTPLARACVVSLETGLHVE
jgi:hypothetical protein